MCELLAIVVKFMLRSPILVSESTSENLTGAQGESPKFRAFLRRRGLYKYTEVFFNKVKRENSRIKAA